MAGELLDAPSHNSYNTLTCSRLARFNEEIRRAERRARFDVDALARVACHSVGRCLDGVVSITKVAEGGFNRVLQITFDDGYAVLARLPYKTTVPKHHAVASEAATLAHLRANGVPVPKVLAYSPDQTNAVRAEYILLERFEGTPLSGQWYSMDTRTRVKIMRQIVDLERQFMSIRFPASGSLYHRRDLASSQRVIPVSDDIVVGPTAQHEWWYRERASLDVDRGPWTTFSSCFEAPAKREMEFCEKFGKPRLHVERYLRELHQYQPRSPIPYQHLLANYLKLAPGLDVPSDHRMARPTVRHPDFSPNNILVNTSNEVVGIIDWQHAVILPLCLCAGIPDHFQNWGDLVSETLSKPEVKLPDHFDQLNHEEQAAVQETMRRRIVHFYYAALTMKSLPDHFDAIRTENCMLRAKLFHHAQAPWEGDSVSLKYTMMQVLTNWPMPLYEGAPTGLMECPVHFSEEEIQNCAEDHRQEQELLQELGEMRDFIGTDALGWVPDEDEFERCKAVIQSIKNGLMEHSSTEMEKTAVVHHFPFDDHDENP
ncbi:aminoglycoside phosphotransferase family protein [Aspergillus brunneoviolaceus CBS 621.78]|uniref:Kinase-like protein n=1 Tax=Aspergillus brunneoviolaceus CBS 621.78 TaxID=1450534 RepID=A0ACD1GAP8_9EURO|nr:kinase-like protein [Aspergillus brunneoviolaceus CBS 621.78]RAH46310.1 kinase-like protein [Aspergillus brunneoviolaceus CBS 621.78]